MTTSEDQVSNIPFSSEQTCVVYLFRKRWPSGFKCSFCGALQPEIAPAYVVVCRYCRKQTSITAHTLMHGSKKNLVAWMRVASLFCLQRDGLSARELQRIMELSCYQTAWSWLQKIRHGAARAESTPCEGSVIFDFTTLPVPVSYTNTAPDIGMALELSQRKENARVRFTALNPSSPDNITAAINTTIARGSTLFIKDHGWLSSDCIIEPDLLGQPTKEQLKRCHLLLQKTVSWLGTVYRGAINPRHLQGYLDEFCFRYNTAFLHDHFAALDHLLTGLVCTTENTTTPTLPVNTGGRP